MCTRMCMCVMVCALVPQRCCQRSSRRRHGRGCNDHDGDFTLAISAADVAAPSLPLSLPWSCAVCLLSLPVSLSLSFERLTMKLQGRSRERKNIFASKKRLLTLASRFSSTSTRTTARKSLSILHLLHLVLSHTHIHPPPLASPHSLRLSCGRKAGLGQDKRSACARGREIRAEGKRGCNT